SKLYNDSWLFDLGFLKREQYNDLRDLISRLFEERATVVVGPGDTLATAHNRMRNNGYSQLPVLDGDTFLGVLAEGDIMHAVAQSDFSQPVKKAMNPNFPVMPAERPLSQLIELLEIEPAVAIVKEQRFCGLVTRSDILNYLRREEEGKKAQDYGGPS
ncbi:MAG TPA: CBS domain-containing protein, partial [Gammaproteobacteria bacterium]|nr:CBS domain-containing protein [Gammaproteobacteria bacterium]